MSDRRSKATEAAFDALHALLAESMTEELERDLYRARQPKFIDGEGGKKELNPEWAPLSPKLLGVIRAFLKDNGIDTPASSPRFSGLVSKLGDIPADEDGWHIQ